MDEAVRMAALSQGWVGFSTTITNLAANLFLSECLKMLEPKILIIMGGPQVTDRNAEELLSSFSSIDAAVPAPAFQALERLVKRRDSNDGVPGAWVRCADGRIVNGGPSEWPLVDELPPANWSDLRLDLYDPSLFLEDCEEEDLASYYPAIPLHTSRGCSHNRCGFCYNVAIYPRYASQSPQRVLRELTHQIDQIGSRGFFFTDFELNGDPKRLEDTCDLIIREDLDVRFFSWFRLDKITYHSLEKLYNAGGRQIFIGLEAVDDHLLRLMRKGYNSSLAIEKLRVLDDFATGHPGFAYKFNLIKHYPGETLESVKNTLDIVTQYGGLFEGRLAAAVEFILHEGTQAHRDARTPLVGCMDVLLPRTAKLRSYQFLADNSEDSTTLERAKIWHEVASQIQ
jgi:radical SAM superfamily enzyme YgiQ (UPF0313 family)